MHYLRTLSAFVVLTVNLGVNTVFAIELGASAAQSVEVTDNAHSTDDNKASEAISTTTLTTNLSHRSSELDMSFNYALDHVRYQKDRFDDTNTVVGQGSVTWYMVPGRVEWFVSDVESYSIVDRRQADSPDNRAQSSSLSTGPKVIVALSPVDSAILDAIYTKSTTDNDSKSKSFVNSGSVGWTHLLSETKQFAIKYTQSKTDFDDNGNNFKTNTVTGTLDANTASGSFVVGIGRTRLDRDSGDSTDSNSFDIQYVKNWLTSALSISAKKELTDTVSAFNLSGTQANSIFSQSLELEDSVILSTLEVSYNSPIFGALTTLGVSGSFQEEEFQTLNDVQRIKGLEVDLSHRLTQYISLSITYDYQRVQFDSVETKRIDREHTLSLGSDYNMSKELKLSVNLSGNLRKIGREQSIDLVDIEKNSLIFSASYQFL